LRALEGVLRKYAKLERKLEGKRFAMRGEEVVAVADTNEELWARLLQLNVKEVLIGYAPTKEERG